MRQIPLYRAGNVVATATVDDADYDFLSRWRWRLSASGYAVCQIWLNGKPTNKKMHRAVVFPGYMDSPNLGRPGVNEVDHANLDRLDNRRENLRIGSRAQNQWNTRARRPGAYKGVHQRRRRLGGFYQKFYGKITVNRKVYATKDFSTAEAARDALSALRQQFHGEFARC